MIASYSSIYNLGHSAVATLLHGPVIVEEKIDGSQFSFTKRADTHELECRSKGAIINMIAPEGMFAKAVEVVKGLAPLLVPGITYRGEYLAKPKHNVMAYDRVPKNHVILFDVEYVTHGTTYFQNTFQKDLSARVLGMEAVPVLFDGMLEDVTLLRKLLDTESCLGGQKIEGVVIKPKDYDLFGRDKKVLMGKFVSEAFKEVHANEWKKEHGPKSSTDILNELALNYATPARWQKALIHLREAGKIGNTLKDIGELIAAVPPDVLKECREEIAEKLFAWAWPNLRRSVTRGLPEWYKQELLALQFTA